MILVLGDGLLGSEVIGQSGWNYISRKEDGIDFTDLNSWSNKIPKETTHIVNLIANTDTYSRDAKSMYRVNYVAVMGLAEFCNERDIKLVHYSTDYVYEDSESNATETSEVGPVSHYAISKWLADEYIMRHSNDYLICRGSQKINPFPYDMAFTDLMGNFDYPEVLSNILIDMVRMNASGLYNIGTPTKSMYDLAKESNSNVSPGLAPDFMPKDVTMDLTKMNNLFETKGKDLI